jgi:hypothetical protein
MNSSSYENACWLMKIAERKMNSNRIVFMEKKVRLIIKFKSGSKNPSTGMTKQRLSWRFEFFLSDRRLFQAVKRCTFRIKIINPNQVLVEKI